jgi:hypothetical protein
MSEHDFGEHQPILIIPRCFEENRHVRTLPVLAQTAKALVGGYDVVGPEALKPPDESTETPFPFSSASRSIVENREERMSVKEVLEDIRDFLRRMPPLGNLHIGSISIWCDAIGPLVLSAGRTPATGWCYHHFLT